MSDDVLDDEAAPRRWPLLVGLVVVAGGLLAALFLFDGDDADAPTVTSDPAAAPATEPANTEAPTTEPPTTGAPTTGAPTTEPPTSGAPTTGAPTTEQPDPEQPESAMWPWAVTGTRFDEPTAAAESFATDFLGFSDPIVGEFLAGDTRSGEVEIRPRVDGASAVGATVVFVRQVRDDDSWWVLGAAAESITIDTPEQGDVVTSPLTVSGTARAFEGTVDVELRADGNGEPIATSFVTGGVGPELEPFEATVEFDTPGDVAGALVLLSTSPEDGSVVEASAVRISYSD